MLTRNFMRNLGGDGGIVCENASNISGTCENGEGFPYNQNFGKTTSNSPFSDDTWNESYIKIGTGNTKPKITDYKLENEITERYDFTKLSKRYVTGGDKDALNIYSIITNNSDSSINFTEIGWFVIIGGFKLLYAREVYDTPITIAPGESVAVNINIL